MTTYCSAALFLFLIAFFRRSSMEDRIVNVKYSREPLKAMEGQFLTMKCSVEYSEVHCKGLKAWWCLLAEQRCRPLTTPDRYLIHINETKMDKLIQRDVFIQFKNMSRNDTALYQCTAVCQHPGTSAMGRLLNLTVTENPNKNQENGQNQSDRCSVDMILLVVSFTLSWIPEM
ncbi:uncharacterized protein zgc:174945 [Pygocentrus nattereri]|uniref:uncharacterized protein zgc:174945 n=1 Tax=Pygocentrus nattereri TaxID=42514 RepID=UPI001890DB8F|nr:uncharacterized protein zgc:174945 [Pygocentrus nattereri]